MRRKRLAFENRCNQQVFVTLKPRGGVLQIEVQPEQDEGAKKIAPGKVYAVSASSIGSCISANETLSYDVIDHPQCRLRDPIRRPGGLLFVISTEKGESRGSVRQK
jgi:hypothetical protein